MRSLRRIRASLALTFIVTAVLAAATTILVMFTKGKELGHHTGLFGSIFFDAYKTGSGSIMIGLGVENPLTLAFIFIIAFAIILASFHLFAAWRQRKE